MSCYFESVFRASSVQVVWHQVFDFKFCCFFTFATRNNCDKKIAKVSSFPSFYFFFYLKEVKVRDCENEAAAAAAAFIFERI